MASGRTVLCVCTVLLVLLVADVSVAADQTATVTASVEKYYLRGNVAGASEEEASEKSFESFARRELGDYGTNPAGPNCRKRPCRR